MSRFLYAILAVAILAFACYAADRELVSHISSSTSLNIANCANAGGPSKAAVRIYVDNSLGQLMGVNYEYFNNNTRQWESGGKLCNVVMPETCDGNIQVTLGGKGNGTFTSEMVRVSATSEAAPGDVFKKSFQLTINHFTGERESTLTAQMQEQAAALTTARTACASNTRCCSQESRDAIDRADTHLSTARVALSACAFETMYSSITEAESLLDGTTRSISTCLASATPTPAPNATPAPTAAGTATPAPTAQQTGTPAPTTPPATPAPTPAPTTKVCPLMAGLLVALLGCAAVASKK